MNNPLTFEIGDILVLPTNPLEVWSSATLPPTRALWAQLPQETPPPAVPFIVDTDGTIHPVEYLDECCTQCGNECTDHTIGVWRPTQEERNA